jgi:hypothetical protein
MQKIKDIVARYSGYTRFIEPIWSRYVGWVGAHPKTAAVLLVGLAVVAAL